MSNKNKDKEIGKQQPKAAVPTTETKQGTTAPRAGTDAQAGTVAPAETVHPNPARAPSDTAEVVTTESSTKAAETKTAEKPKVSDALAKIGKSILKSNPAMSVVYMTSDGRGFYEKNDADNHAHNLNDKAVTPVKK